MVNATILRRFKQVNVWFFSRCITMRTCPLDICVLKWTKL